MTTIRIKIVQIAFIFLFGFIVLTIFGNPVFAYSITSKIFGNRGNDYGVCIQKTFNDKIIISGTTSSKAFPGVSKYRKFGSGGRNDVFVAIISEKSLEIESMMVFGGSDDDFVKDISVDKDGNILVFGDTVSKDFPFHTAFEKGTPSGKSNIFLMRVDHNLQHVLNAIIVKGNDYTYASKVLVNNGYIYLSGTTSSSDLNFTEKGVKDKIDGAKAPRDNYGFDGFILKFDGKISSILASTYIGGNADDFIKSMAVDGSGKLILGGYTCSTDFPITPGTYNKEKPYGGVNFFIMSLSNDLKHVAKSMLFKSQSLLYLQDVAIGKDGSFWMVGYCAYPGTIHTTKNVLFPKAPNGGYDGFIIHMKSDLKTILQSSFFGGNNDDFPTAIHVAPGGEIIVTGFTDSFNSFPLTIHEQQYPINFGHYDAFVTVLNSNLTHLEYSSLFGGPGIDRFVNSLVSGNDLYLIGDTTSGSKTFMNLFLFTNKGKKHKVLFSVMKNILSTH